MSVCVGLILVIHQLESYLPGKIGNHLQQILPKRRFNQQNMQTSCDISPVVLSNTNEYERCVH